MPDLEMAEGHKEARTPRVIFTPGKIVQQIGWLVLGGGEGRLGGDFIGQDDDLVDAWKRKQKGLEYRNGDDALDNRGKARREGHELFLEKQGMTAFLKEQEGFLMKRQAFFRKVARDYQSKLKHGIGLQGKGS